jgi:hypothetical protein
MPGFTFELATEADDAELRRILAATPTPGHIRIRMEREPSWFLAAAVDGHIRQVVACRQRDSGRIIGFGCRSVRRLFVNGRAIDVGYLSGLRVLPEFRNQGLVARGYAFFRKLDADGRAPFYLTTIAAGNETALTILTSGRAGLPTYRPAGTYRTFAIPLPRRPARSIADATMTYRAATRADGPAIAELIAAEGPRRQFFPAEDADLLAGERTFHGLSLDRVILAERGGTLLGLVGAWDQIGFRQNIVEGYEGWLGWFRPFYNVWQLARGHSPLTTPGEPLRCLIAAAPLVRDGDEATLFGLLTEVRRRFSGGPWSHLLIGCHDTDALSSAVRSMSVADYATNLYLAAWADGAAAIESLDGRPRYLELGTL